MDFKEILSVKLNNEDFDSSMTIKDYFKELLKTLWREGEEFSGKRPFGNSGWKYDMYKPLVNCKAIEGVLDEDGYIEEVDTEVANALVYKLIEECFK